MARNFDVRIVLERGIIEIFLKCLVSIRGGRLYRCENTERAVQERAERESGHLAGRNFVGRLKKNRENADVSRANIRHRSLVILREILDGIYRKFLL
jgi:hypothetical protein